MVVNTDNYHVNKRFIFHMLSIVNFSPLISGSGQPQIVRSPLEKMKIWLPDIETQNKISTFLDAFESKVLNEESILHLLNNVKHVLLSQMFI